LIERSGDAVNKIVMKNETEVNYIGVAVVFGGPLLVMIAICTVILGGKEDANVVGAIKREESAAAARNKKT
jgi:3-polyprenyl-4-hydroxybenzoate decarboxylase